VANSSISSISLFLASSVQLRSQTETFRVVIASEMLRCSQKNPVSTSQIDEHPSPDMELPSSQVSPARIMPSPHGGVHTSAPRAAEKEQA
jgi:hypothetical protein